MDRYKLKIDDKQNFFRLLDGLGAETVAKLSGCSLSDVIITPEINLWQIILRADKNFDKKIFRVAEEFLHRRYNALVEIKHEISIADEFVPTEKKSTRKKSSAREKSSAAVADAPQPAENSLPSKKIIGKKISGVVTKISDITEDSGTVIIIGEISADDVNGVKLREFKSGSACVSFCVTDDTDGICCKKFFKGDKKSDAQPFADTLKAGSLVKISGATKYDDYLKETVIFINALEMVETSSTAREDTAAVKRVEPISLPEGNI